jgi:hypothetical protein
VLLCFAEQLRLACCVRHASEQPQDTCRPDPSEWAACAGQHRVYTRGHSSMHSASRLGFESNTGYRVGHLTAAYLVGPLLHPGRQPFCPVSTALRILACHAAAAAAAAASLAATPAVEDAEERRAINAAACAMTRLAGGAVVAAVTTAAAAVPAAENLGQQPAAGCPPAAAAIGTASSTTGAAPTATAAAAAPAAEDIQQWPASAAAAAAAATAAGPAVSSILDCTTCAVPSATIAAAPAADDIKQRRIAILSAASTPSITRTAAAAGGASPHRPCGAAAAVPLGGCCGAWLPAAPSCRAAAAARLARSQRWRLSGRLLPLPPDLSLAGCCPHTILVGAGHIAAGCAGVWAVSRR